MSATLPLLFLTTILSAEPSLGALNAGTLALEGAISQPSQSIGPGKAVELALPALPSKTGKAILLRFRAVSHQPTEAGCSFGTAVRVNGANLGRYTSAGEERLVGRSPTFEFRQGRASEFHVFGAVALTTMFAPDPATADAMTADGLGATFCLDISDVARGVDGNTLTFHNAITQALTPKAGDLLVEGIEIGWFDRASLPKPKEEVPVRGPVTAGVEAVGIRLSQAKGGGFVIGTADGVEMLVETALGMNTATPAALLAEDCKPGEALREGLTLEERGSVGFRLVAAWTEIKLIRTVEIRDGLVVWKECWTNTGQKILGVPFRHRFFLREEPAGFWLGGTRESTFLPATSQNPTVYVDSTKRPGAGFGIAAESDWLRLLMGSRAKAGVGEVFSETLALAPGASVDFEWSIIPVKSGGYWSFLNGVRERWGLNGVTMRYPVFFDYIRAKEGADETEILRNSLGHLGPVMVTAGPWQRGEPDARIVVADKYPKLAKDATPAPGRSPDLDVEAFLTFEHREVYWKEHGAKVNTIRAACPQVKILGLMHPSMEVVYKPLEARWPMAAEAIKTPEGGTFEDASYSRIWLGAMAGKDWGVLYYVPRPSSRYLDELLRSERRALDQYGVDGMYSDEFSWAYIHRGYSRYDYSCWDGHSADLDAEGNVLRLKSDNAHTTESAQSQIVHEALDRGRFFLANTAASLRSMKSLPYQQFVEGGNGPSWFSTAHCSPTPLVLGNSGDETTQKGVFETVKNFLAAGCIYSPTAVNLLLKGSDNFVCKLYPLTVREIYAGTILGDERLITASSGSYAWPKRKATVRLYLYDANGDLLPAPPTVAADRELSVEVPPGGLVIAEVVAPE